MAYNTSKGPRGLGDIKNEDDVDTQIDWDNDKITFKTNNIGRFVIENSQISASTDATIFGNLVTEGNFKVSGAATFAAATTSFTNISGSGTLEAVGATTLGNTLNVSGALVGASNIGTTNGFLTASAQLKGLSLVLEGQTAIDKNRNATLAALSGSGTLQAVGATILGSTLNVTGAVTLSGPASGSGAGPGSYLGVSPAGLLVLTSSLGETTSPGGSDTQVQFNDGDSFGGDAGLTYNKTTDMLGTRWTP